MDFSEFKKWNEEMFKKYNNERMYFHPNPLIRYTENKRVKLVINFLNLKEDDKVLSVGCGEGYVIDKMNKGEIYGIDLSEEAIKRAKQKLKTKKQVHLQIGDALNMPFPQDFFDKIECTEVIEHVLDPRKLIEEITRVSKRSSVIVITIPNELLINKIKKIVAKLGLFDLLLKDVPKDMMQEWHLHFFTLKKFKEIIKNKLKILKFSAVPFRWLPIRYVIKCQKIQ